MKAIALTLFFFAASQAQASYMATHCSNSNGTVTWESGYDNNTINLKYANFVAGTLTLDMEQVQITFDKQVTISEKKIHECGFRALTHVYAGKVVVKPAAAHPDVLRGQFPENKVVTEVICTHHTNGEAPCPIKP